MANIGWRFVCWMASRIIRLRYRIEISGLREIQRNGFQKSGGVLFMPNHPALADPLIASTILWPKWRVRPVVVDYMYFTPGLHFLLKGGMRAIKVPDFRATSNSYKLARTDRALQDIVEGLEGGDNILLYPSGRLQKTNRERIGGASAAYDILHRAPNANVILVRTTGLWGSVLGWGIEGRRPLLGKGMLLGIKILLKNGIFFAPKRRVLLEFEDVTGRLPLGNTKLVLNRFLEEWYDQRAIAMQTEGEPLKLVSYSRWRPEYPEVTYKAPVDEVDIASVPIETQREVIRLIARISKRKPSEIQPEAHLFTDLGMDSLDIAELIAALDRGRVIQEGTSLDLLTVGAVMTLAAGHAQKGAEKLQPSLPPPSKWSRLRPSLSFPSHEEASTLQRVFLQTCERMGRSSAAYDEIAGLLSYHDLKVRALLLARYLRHLEGQYIGILLPSSVAVEVVVLATMLAGKIPVMINWTVGPRYLKAVRDTCDLKVVLSSWSFLDRLDGADLTPLHDLILTVERLRIAFGIKEQLRAALLARKSVERIVRELGLQNISEEERAVILTTSGTEALPKAVPLTHRNILSNQRAAFESIGVMGEGIFCSFLPPFHSLGFNVTGLLPLAVGARVVYAPDPTDGLFLARQIERFRANIVCTAPTFLEALFRVSSLEQLRSLQLVVTGAEAAPKELFERVKSIGPKAELLEGYGITECSPILTMNRYGLPHAGVGKPLSSVELLIVNVETKVPCSSGESGLILARGPNVFDGYLGETLVESFITIDGTRWYVTGDLGRIDDEGYLHLAGRLKRFVKIGGEMISLPAIEAALLEATRTGRWSGGPQSKELALVPVEMEGSRPLLVLYTTFFTDRDEVNQMLSELGFSNLSRVDSVHELREMPLMGTGKYNYRALQQQAEERCSKMRGEERS